MFLAPPMAKPKQQHEHTTTARKPTEYASNNAGAMSMRNIMNSEFNRKTFIVPNAQNSIHSTSTNDIYFKRPSAL